MNDFVRRNMPVLVIGLVTFVIFVGIIVASQSRSAPSPELTTVDEAMLITDTAYKMGDDDAPVKIVEFSDFQCPGCAAFFPIIKSYYSQNPETVQVIYRHFPLSIHPRARKAAEAAEIAGNEGKFWEYSTLLFSNQDAFERQDLIDYAKRIGLEPESFARDLDNGTYAPIINADLEAARVLGLNSTPTVFVNGERIVYQTFDELQSQITEIILQYKTPLETPESSQ